MKKPDPMNVEDCAMVIQQLTLLAQLIRNLPLKEFVHQANHEDSIGPILDPTGWIKHRRRATQVKKLAEASLAYQEAVREALPLELIAQTEKRNE